MKCGYKLLKWLSVANTNDRIKTIIYDCYLKNSKIIRGSIEEIQFSKPINIRILIDLIKLYQFISTKPHQKPSESKNAIFLYDKYIKENRYGYKFTTIIHLRH